MQADFFDLRGPLRTVERVYSQAGHQVDEAIVGLDLSRHAELGQSLAEGIAVIRVPVAVGVAILGVIEAVKLRAVPVRVARVVVVVVRKFAGAHVALNYL